MKLIKGNKPVSQQRRLKDTLLRYFLAASIISSVFIVSKCDLLTNFHDDLHGNGNPPPPGLGGNQTSNYITQLFVTVGESAGGSVGGIATSWALGAIGLSDASPNSNEQLSKIDDDLNVIITQLNDINKELSQIENELQQINCGDWQQTLGPDKSRIDDLLQDYDQDLKNVQAGLPVSSSDMAKLADEILAEGNYTDKTDMFGILTDLQDNLIVPVSGTLSACIQTFTLPADASFGADTIYYNTVKAYIDYYAQYELKGLLLLNEAYHYRAWQAAGSPNSDSLSADSTSYVCNNSSGESWCNKAASAVNYVYNSLIQQYALGGAPYTNKNFVFEYNPSYLWVKSLEDFTVAAGGNCTEPLTSATPCGITAGFYNDGSLQSVNYRGYSGWQKAGSALLVNLLAGWKSGTAGTYLEQNLGFENMENKIIISTNEEEITLNEVDGYQYVIPFFDTDWDYNFLPSKGGPARNEVDFQEATLVKSRNEGGLCRGLVYYYMSIDYNKNPKVPSNRNNFYDASGHCRYCQPLSDYDYTTQFSFSVLPGYLAEQGGKTNHENSARQYRWPVRIASALTCTENRPNKNPGGMWTMCGDDLTAWLEYYFPRPQTCDNTDAATQCSTDGGTIAKAKSTFDVYDKTKNRF